MFQVWYTKDENDKYVFLLYVEGYEMFINYPDGSTIRALEKNYQFSSEITGMYVEPYMNKKGYTKGYEYNKDSGEYKYCGDFENDESLQISLRLRIVEARQYIYNRSKSPDSQSRAIKLISNIICK